MHHVGSPDIYYQLFLCILPVDRMNTGNLIKHPAG